jgi:hypothetical protein
MALRLHGLEHSDEMVRAHLLKDCGPGPCTIHRRTNHVMRPFSQHWRADRGIMERICSHGVGHPDPDDYRVRIGDDSGIHGCDGCCAQSTIAEEGNDGQP